MKRTVLAVLVAAVLGLVGCAAVLLYVKGADNRAVAGKQAVRVLIAAQRIPAGTTGAQIKSGEYVELVTMPKSTVPPDALSEIDNDLESLALTADLKPRQLVLRGAFDTPTVTSGGLNIPEGKIAVTVPVANTAGTIFLQPGSKIAVFGTFTQLDEGNSAPAGAKLEFEHGRVHRTRLVLPSVEAIALSVPGQVVSANGPTERGASDVAAEVVEGDEEKVEADGPSMLVTLAVNQEEAERLIHVAQTETIYIALLEENSKLQPGPGVDTRSVFK